MIYSLNQYFGGIFIFVHHINDHWRWNHFIDFHEKTNSKESPSKRFDSHKRKTNSTENLWISLVASSSVWVAKVIAFSVILVQDESVFLCVKFIPTCVDRNHHFELEDIAVTQWHKIWIYRANYLPLTFKNHSKSSRKFLVGAPKRIEKFIYWKETREKETILFGGRYLRFTHCRKLSFAVRLEQNKLLAFIEFGAHCTRLK